MFTRALLKIATLPLKPKLTVVLVGDDPASQTYVNSKAKRCEALGLQSETNQTCRPVLEASFTPFRNAQ
ncbi:MAG: tetrahydrofolate dehydrogenase/cyclohydrolase catalytic domain-containing protein [Bdellovibrionota bacterium]